MKFLGRLAFFFPLVSLFFVLTFVLICFFFMFRIAFLVAFLIFFVFSVLVFVCLGMFLGCLCLLVCRLFRLCGQRLRPKQEAKTKEQKFTQACRSQQTSAGSCCKAAFVPSLG